MVILGFWVEHPQIYRSPKRLNLKRRAYHGYHDLTTHPVQYSIGLAFTTIAETSDTCMTWQSHSRNSVHLIKLLSSMVSVITS